MLPARGEGSHFKRNIFSNAFAPSGSGCLPSCGPARCQIRSRMEASMRHRRNRTARVLTGLALGLCCGAVLAQRQRRARFSFRGKTVLITGGSRGLGLVMARQFAAEGAQLALVARNQNELERAANELSRLGADVLPVVCDVRNKAQVNEAVQKVVARFGRLDVLVNNAGIIQVGPLDQMTVADFEDALAVHLFG